MAEQLTNLIIFFSTIVASLSYSYLITSNLQTPTYKLISLIPIFYLFTTLPLLLSSPFATAVAAFFFTWLANFKLLLFTFDRGPLYKQKALIQFITIASLPARFKSNHLLHSNKKSPSVLIELVVFPLLISLVYKLKNYSNTHVVLVIYFLLVFLLVDLLVFVSNAVVWTVVGVELEPP
ncbi:putative long-chain-alcohol O-fatty-acyltransferase [Helianthus debilis subsp. tardiflorus]